MGLFQQACLTYDAMKKEHAGVYIQGEKEPLCPISHIITQANIEIVLDEHGNFRGASAVNKDEPKIIIPVTEDSAGRTRAPCAHPLCDQLGYLGGHDEKKYQLYVEQLKAWLQSPWSHPKIQAIYQYISQKTILSDLSQAGLISLNEKGIPDGEKHLVRWRILGTDPEECWRDQELFEAFIRFYGEQKADTQFCMVCGEEKPLAVQNPKGIVAANGNAKLISANDSSGFTYRGRFSEDWQAATVSYEASQKAHAALRWVIVNQGEKIGSSMFVCWNPEGIKLQSPQSALHPRKIEKIHPSDYRSELRKTLLGKKEELPADAKAILASFSAATTGRLSLTYYNELFASDFLDRLHDWDEFCCWWYGGNIYSPYLQTIVDCAYGTERKAEKKAESKQEKVFVTDERVMAQQLQRLIACRVSRARMPTDLVQRLVDRASTPQRYSAENWRKVVSTACAVIQKYKEENCMEWPLDKQDRDFQFGRLLAVMERAEEDYYYNAGKPGDKPRQTTAIKSLAAFKRTPMEIFERVNAHLETAYLSRLNPWQKTRYEKLACEITVNISSCSGDINAPLNSNYLIGYELQRNEFFKTKDKQEEEEQ